MRFIEYMPFDGKLRLQISSECSSDCTDRTQLPRGSWLSCISDVPSGLYLYTYLSCPLCPAGMLHHNQAVFTLSTFRPIPSLQTDNSVLKNIFSVSKTVSFLLGNKWNFKKFVPYSEMLDSISHKWPNVERISDRPNDTSKVGSLLSLYTTIICLCECLFKGTDIRRVIGGWLIEGGSLIKFFLMTKMDLSVERLFPN